MRSGRGWAVEASGSGPLRARYCWGFHLLFETPRDKHACPLFMQGDLSPSNLLKLVSGKNQGLGVPAPGSGLGHSSAWEGQHSHFRALAGHLWGQRLELGSPLPSWELELKL